MESEGPEKGQSLQQTNGYLAINKSLFLIAEALKDVTSGDSLSCVYVSLYKQSIYYPLLSVTLLLWCCLFLLFLRFYLSTSNIRFWPLLQGSALVR